MESTVVLLPHPLFYIQEKVMALSDFLTSDEWDACFYASMGGKASGGPSFGAAMHKTIDALLATGYRFEGLDAGGNKREQIHGTGNPYKVCIFLGNPHNCDVLGILDRGRKFLKIHMPDWVDETEEEWAEQMTTAREQKAGVKI